jgi:lipoprotein NlpI
LRWKLAFHRVLPVLATAFIAAMPADASETPLLDYALTLSYATMPYEERYRESLEQARHALDRTPPPRGKSCAESLGAPRFASMYGALGEALAGLGRHDEALEAYERAIECSPREAPLHASRAAQLFYLGREDEACAALKRGLAIAPMGYRLNNLIAQLDFLDGRWQRAHSRFARIAQLTRDPDQAAYWAILAWLAQRHDGQLEPKLPIELTGWDWPRPILSALRGATDEQELVSLIEAADDELLRREMLCEALFYMGHGRLLAGEADTARRYFAAAVNLKVLYFIEHHLARATLARLGEEERGN